MLRTGAGPSAACAVIKPALILEAAGETVEAGADNQSRHVIPLGRSGM
jgi:hypothetical protein